MKSKLFYGDNLDVLRESVDDKSIDLIYLDPPFNSDASYNVLFKTPAGKVSDAQAEAFQDTWSWGPRAEMAYEEVMSRGRAAARVLSALYSAFGKADMMAYLAMMTVRLEELARKLKPTGSLYLHCDPTASHYLKIILDGIFGPERFLNEVIWKRTSAHSAAKRWGDVHDSILFYSASDDYCWNKIVTEYDDAYKARYKNVDDEGRRWTDDNLTAPGVRHGDSGAEWRGFNPTKKGNHWKVSRSAVVELIGEEAADKLSTTQKLDFLDKNRLIHWPRGDGFPRFKRVLGKGLPLQDIITDIPPLNSQAQERLGYPTQKPLALLERVIAASSNPGDVVLDPFCGCGTTIEAAERLGRRWIGIDVTHYAISLIEARIKKNFPKTGVDVDGRPEDYVSACDLAARSEYQFQWWANWLLQVQDYRERKKGPDGGIDGTIYFPNGPNGVGRVLISVKAGKNLGVNMVRELLGTMTREGAEMGTLVTLHEPTHSMRQEADKAGIVKTAPGTFPKLQILWIKDWFDGKRPSLPRPFEPQKLRLAARPKKPDDRQLGFTFTIPGSGKKRKGEVVYADPRVTLAGN